MSEQHRPWYREPFVWLIIAFPLTSVILGVTLYIVADRTKDGLVVDDYYKKGKEINLSLARDQAAQHAGLRAQVQLDAATQKVVMSLSAKPGVTLPNTISLRWLHATRDGFDRTQELLQVSPGQYRATFPELAPGRWYLHAEAQDWRIQGSLRVPAETRLSLGPSIAGGASIK